jgi:hypothetical protein
VIRWRRTDASTWEHSQKVYAPLREVAVMGRQLARKARPGERVTAESAAMSVALSGIRVDDYVFGVSSVSKDGFESPVASAVPGGAFAPYSPPPPAQP